MVPLFVLFVVVALPAIYFLSNMLRIHYRHIIFITVLAASQCLNTSYHCSNPSCFYFNLRHWWSPQSYTSWNNTLECKHWRLKEIKVIISSVWKKVRIKYFRFNCLHKQSSANWRWSTIIDARIIIHFIQVHRSS